MFCRKKPEVVCVNNKISIKGLALSNYCSINMSVKVGFFLLFGCFSLFKQYFGSTVTFVAGKMN